MATSPTARHWIAHLTLALGLVFTTVGWVQATSNGAIVRWRLETALKAQQAAEATLVAREAQRAKRGAIAAQREASVAAAIASAPEWADTPIPTEVIDALDL